MTGERWREAWEIYRTACQMPEERQAAYVRSASADAETAQLVEDLLRDPDPDPEADSPDEWPQIGREIGRFRVEAPLGRGGMGEVYAALDTELNRTVALKFLATAAVGTSGQVSRFIREARAASALNHPGIVTVHDVVRSGESLAIVMELVEGRPLRQLCGEPRSPAEVAAWGGQIARALSVAHQHGIVHRDIKPENLMQRPDGYIKVLDFGLARHLEGDLSASLPAAGTLRYMAPEQARGVAATPRCDVFSLGVVLYELVAGAHPFAAASAIETAHAIQRQRPASPSRRNAACPRELDDVIMAMLAKEAEERPGAAEVAERLQAIERMGAAVRGGRRLGTWARWAAAGVCIAVAVASWRWAESRRGAPQTDSADLPFLPPAPLHAPVGNEGQPTFSPDGESVAYVWDRGETGGNRVIVVQAVGGAPALLTDSPADDSSPAWSPQGKQIAFLRRQDGSVDVMIADASTRVARRIGGIGSEQPSNQRLIAWTPDGAALVVADNPPGKRENLHLYRMDLASGGKAELTAPPDGSSDVAPQFSPDGRWMALLRARRGAAYELLEMETARGAIWAPRVLVESESPINSFAWTSDNRRLLFGSGQQSPVTLWEVAASGGPPQRAPFRLFSPARQIAIAPRGRRLAYVRPMTDSNIWRIERDGRAERLIASPQEDSDPRYSPDGSRIAFASGRTEMSEIWVCGRDGGDPRQLTFQRSVSGSPAWSPDGGQIAFHSNTGGQWAIWVVGAHGGPPRRLVEENAEGMRPAWSRDGKIIYFSSNRTGREEIWGAAFNGRTGQVTHNGGYEGYEGPDGYLYFTKGLETPGIWRMRLRGGPEGRVPALDEMPGHRYWEMASGGIYFAVALPRPAIKFFDFQTGRVRVAAAVKEPPQRATNPILPPGGLTVAPDGKTFLYVQFEGERMNVLLADMPGY